LYHAGYIHVHVPAPRPGSQDFFLESDMDHHAGGYEDVPVFLPRDGIAYTDDIDVKNYESEEDTVNID
jgi:hypothetical protein